MRSGPDCARWPRIVAAVNATPSVAELFAADPRRFERCSVEAEGFLFDFSRQRLAPELVGDFAQLADELDLSSRIAAQFAGNAINLTERRAVLHTALRRIGPPTPLLVDGVDVDALARGERERMLAYARAVREGTLVIVGGETEGRWLGGTDRQVRAQLLEAREALRGREARRRLQRCARAGYAHALGGERLRAHQNGHRHTCERRAHRRAEWLGHGFATSPQPSRFSLRKLRNPGGVG